VGWFLRACCCPIALRSVSVKNRKTKTPNQRKQTQNQTPTNLQIKEIEGIRNGAIELIVVEIAPRISKNKNCKKTKKPNKTTKTYRL